MKKLEIKDYTIYNQPEVVTANIYATEDGIVVDVVEKGEIIKAAYWTWNNLITPASNPPRKWIKGHPLCK